MSCSSRVRNPFRSENHRKGLEHGNFHPCKHLRNSPKRGLLRRGFLSGSLAIGSESAQPSSYHPTPRGSTPGVTGFSVPLCEFSHPSAVDLGLSVASKSVAKLNPKRDPSPQTAAPFQPITLRRSISPPRTRVNAPLGESLPISAPARRRPHRRRKNTCSNDHAGTPKVRPKYAAPAEAVSRPASASWPRFPTPGASSRCPTPSQLGLAATTPESPLFPPRCTVTPV